MDETEQKPTSKNPSVRYRKWLFSLAIIASFFLGTYLEKNGKFGTSTASIVKAGEALSSYKHIENPTIKWGFVLDTFSVKEQNIQPNQVLGSVLEQSGFSAQAIDELVANSTNIFKFSNWQTGKKFALLSRQGQATPDYLIYEPNIREYFVFDLKNLNCEKVVRPVTKEIKTSAGEIESSLWKAMTDAGMSFELADKMEDALQWSVDFHHAQKGDRFKLLYEEETVECEPAGIGRVYAATYETGGKEFHSIYFESDKKEQIGYYDLEGRPMNKGFLKAPVKYARISSGYNLRRFHPILKYVRPHFGTDYAAPAGTPILAVGSGTVIEAAYGKGNGNFVKIKHDNTYQTQYLHMRGFAKGIRSGVHVNQGDVIGYVGSTGLATGPHVCFRFWKNGQQVNHLNLKFPPPAPLAKEELPAFFALRDQYMEQLQKLAFRNAENLTTTSAEPVKLPYGKP